MSAAPGGPRALAAIPPGFDSAVASACRQPTPMDVDCLHHFEYRGDCPRRPARIKLLPMKRTIALVTAMLLSVPAAFAQDWAKQTLEKSSRHSEWVAIKHDNRVVQTFVVYPEVNQKPPVVIVIHQIYRLTAWPPSLPAHLPPTASL